MIYPFLFSLSILVFPASACEGQCIEDVTNAFVGNYSFPIHNVFTVAATTVSRLVLHHQDTRLDAVSIKLMDPLLKAYERGAYNTMENAIFPSYFHGKCQVNGVDPAGCPNPDCPVVCGTPGSLVHFYSTLKNIAFNATVYELTNLCTPSNSAYKAFELGVLRERHAALHSRHSRRSLHSPHFLQARHTPLNSIPRDSTAAAPLDRRVVNNDNDAKRQLNAICRNMAQDLASQCGGRGSLSKCSWEQAMKVGFWLTCYNLGGCVPLLNSR